MDEIWDRKSETTQNRQKSNAKKKKDSWFSVTVDNTRLWHEMDKIPMSTSCGRNDKDWLTAWFPMIECFTFLYALFRMNSNVHTPYVNYDFYNTILTRLFTEHAVTYRL